MPPSVNPGAFGPIPRRRFTLGGGTWAIEQNGVRDLMTYNDYRILIGWERKTIRGFTALAEFGYVFARQVSFDSGAPDYDPNDTMMVRMGAKY